MAGDSHTSLTSALPADAADMWRSPEEWAGSPEFRDMISREFPDDVDTWTDPVSRRQFITLMGASLALAGAGRLFASPRFAAQGSSLYESARGNDARQAAFLFVGRDFGRLCERASSSRVTKAGRSKSRGTRTIREALARPTSSRRPPFSSFTIPTGRSRW